MTRFIGVILLCIFLLVYGILSVSNIHFELEKAVLGLSAIAAAIFLAIGK